MIALHPKFITDEAGSELVVIPKKEYDEIIEELEELEDIQLLHEALTEDTGERISLQDYVNKRNGKK